MVMTTLENTKRQMIGEVIQTNLENRTETVRRRRLRWQLVRWGWISLATVSSVFATSLFFASRRSVPTIVAARARVIQQPTPEPSVPQMPPSDLNLSVLPLSVNRIVIDPGHGGDQSGAVSRTGLAEKDVTLDIALRLRR